MATPAFNLDILDSRGAWFRTMARHSRGVDAAVYSARAALADCYWRRLYTAR
jgi:hypothetical protein